MRVPQNSLKSVRQLFCERYSSHLYTAVAADMARAVPFFGAELKYVFLCRMLLSCIRCSIRMHVVVPFYFIPVLFSLLHVVYWLYWFSVVHRLHRLGWTFCYVRLGKKGAVGLAQSRAADGVVPKTSLIGKSYIQRSSLQRLVLFCFVFLLRYKLYT